MKMNAQKFPTILQSPAHQNIHLVSDPHFASYRKHKARMITSTAIAEFAHTCRWNFTITDVLDLADWMYHWMHTAFGENGRAEELKGDLCVLVSCLIPGSKWLGMWRQVF
jgi:hypothetical protein